MYFNMTETDETARETQIEDAKADWDEDLEASNAPVNVPHSEIEERVENLLREKIRKIRKNVKLIKSA